MCNHANDRTGGKRGVFIADVLASRQLCDEHFLLTLAVENFPPSCSGQFVQLQCRPPAEQADRLETAWSDNEPEKPPHFSQPELLGKEPFLRRPFSLAGSRKKGRQVELDVIYRVVGAGTNWLTGVKVGDKLSVLGPLGNGFKINPDKHAAAIIGGGVGIPPMIYLAEALAASGKQTTAFAGVRTKRLLPLTLPEGLRSGCGDMVNSAEPAMCTKEFAAFNTPTVIATDDGSLGFAGFAAQAFHRWLDETATPAGELVVYSCGPEAMMKAVGDICIARRIECQLALERHMACGMGTCQSCIVKIRDGGDVQKGWSYKLCCTDGPVFNAGDVIWD